MNKFEFSNQIALHNSKLCGFAMSMTRNEADARDLVQETIYKAYKNIDQYRPDSNFKAWISMIMRNTFINKYRKNKRRLGMESTLETVYQESSHHHTVYNIGESNQLLEELEGMVDGLNGDLKTTFMMRFSGYKYEEIAKKLNLPLGTVKSKIFYARKELKKMVKETYQISHFSELVA